MVAVASELHSMTPWVPATSMAVRKTPGGLAQPPSTRAIAPLANRSVARAYRSPAALAYTRVTSPASQQAKSKSCTIKSTIMPPERAWSRYQLSPGLRSEEHTSELQSRENLVCRLLLEKKKITN